MEAILVNVGIGILSSVFIAGAGYFKAREEENFDVAKFGKTLILGAVVGGIVGYTGMAPDAVVALPLYAGISTFVENLIKGVLRRN